MTHLYSDRNQPQQARDIEEISSTVWGGIVAIIDERKADKSFGYGFPIRCSICSQITDYSYERMELELISLIPNVTWPLNEYRIPSLYEIFDLIEFLYQKIGFPIPKEDYHTEMVSHDGDNYYPAYYYHYEYDRERGCTLFRDKINILFERNRIAYQLTSMGIIERIAPETIHGELVTAIFTTGNQELDNFLNTARSKYLNPRFEIRKEALERLWDAWERLKTIENHNDKKASIEQLLNVVKQKTGVALDNEAKELTNIGNTFMIRHTEVGKIPIKDSYVVDYLFTRMYAVISLILKATNRIK